MAAVSINSQDDNISPKLHLAFLNTVITPSKDGTAEINQYLIEIKYIFILRMRRKSEKTPKMESSDCHRKRYLTHLTPLPLHTADGKDDLKL